MTARYYDFETDSVLTWDELYRQWQDEIAQAEESAIDFGSFRDEYCITFGEHIANCCGKNGTLIPIPDEFTGRAYYDIDHGDIVDRKTAYHRLETEYGFDDFTPTSEMWEYFIKIELGGETK